MSFRAKTRSRGQAKRRGRAGWLTSALVGNRHSSSGPGLYSRVGLEVLEDRRLLAASPMLLKNIDPGGDSDPNHFVEVGGLTFFVATDPTNGRELWMTDGTTAGTMQVKDINPTAGVGSYPSDLTNVNGELFFTAMDGTNGYELWKSNGTPGGTVQVKNINPAGSSTPSYFAAVDGELFFSANDGTNGYELWKSNGSEAGTVQVKNINPAGSSSPRGLVNVSGELFFSADDGTNGRELWKSNGSEAGTIQVKDINPGAGTGSYPRLLTNVSGELFFSADDGTNGYELWKSNGAEAGTVQVKNIDPAGSSDPSQLTNVNGELFFAADDGTNGRELWKSNGSEAGTIQVKDINPNAGVGSYPIDLTNVSGELFFSATDGTNGYELWKSDGSEAGTVQVKDINPGGDSLFSAGFFTNVNGELYFRANDGTHGYELWKSNGTEAGTVIVPGINPAGNSNPRYLANSNGVLYFSADDGTNGREPWVLAEPLVVTVDGDQDFPNQPDTFLVVRDANDPSKVNVFRNGTLFGQFALATLEQLNVNGLGGNDTLTVDSVNGLITLPGGIHYDGGSGFDVLKILGAAAGSEVLAIGAHPGAGIDTITNGDDVQEIDFENIEPLVTGGVMNNFQISAIVGLASLLQEDNAINYIQSEDDAGLGVDGNWGRITVDNFEPIYFQNKTSLVIDADAGSDEINLNNPSTPTALTDISVHGDDPTASDVLIVNGTTAHNEITYTPTGTASGVVDVDALPTIAFDTVEHLKIVGQGGGDDLIIDTGLIEGTLVLTPGTAFDRGLVDFQTNPSGGAIAPSLEYLDLGIDAGTNGTLEIVNNGGELDDVDFVYRGTDLPDFFNVDNATVMLNEQIDVILTDVSGLTLAGLDGDDQFVVPAVNAFDAITIAGGNPGGSDSLTYLAAAATTTTINIEDSFIDTTAAGPSVTFFGVENIHVEGNDNSVDTFVIDNYGDLTDLQNLSFSSDVDNNDGDTLTVNVNTRPDTINYTPLSPTAAKITRSESDPVISIFGFNNTAGNLRIVNAAAGGNLDTLNVLGSASADVITVTQPAANTTRVSVNPGAVWVPVDYVNLAALNVAGAEGNDRLVVDNSGGLIALAGGTTFDGGSGNDQLVLSGSTAISTATYTVGQQAGSGHIAHVPAAGAVQNVYFNSLEPVIDIVVAATLTVNANNADNAINYIVGPNSGQAIVGNVPSGLVSVDNHETIEFANKTNLVINALAGSDEINLNNSTTPDDLTSITVNGGDPTASDVLIVNGTTNADTITYRPDGAGQGRVTVGALPAIAFNTVEHLTVNGRAGGDTLRVDTVNVNGRELLTPGASFDAGHLDFENGVFIPPALEFLQLGTNGVLSIIDSDATADRESDFVYLGTALSDQFSVSDNGATTSVQLNDRIRVDLQEVSQLTLGGLNGDDLFDITEGITTVDSIVVDGGNPDSGSDVIDYTPNANATTEVDFDASTITSTGVAPVDFTGVEIINVLGPAASTNTFEVGFYGALTDVKTLNLVDADTITVSVLDTPDTINYTPLSPTAARITRSEGGPSINISGFNNTAGNLVVVNPVVAGNTDTLNVFGSANSDEITVEKPGAITTRVTVNPGADWVPIDYQTLTSLTVFGQTGDDDLIVDNSSGLVDLAGGTTFDGGSGNDRLRLEGTTFVDVDTYTVGQQAGSGHVLHVVLGGPTQNVYFRNLEPVIDIVAATDLIVNANNAANAINYIQGPNSGQAIVGNVPSGLVSVDDHETIEFANKDVLTINALAGSDEINLNNPTIPDDLTDIVVNGGDPTASDVLIVNGTPISQDITYRPDGPDSGTVQVQAFPLVTFDTIEHLKVNGRLGSDVLFVDTSEIDGTLVLTPGSAYDRGRVDFRTNPSGDFIAPSVEYLGLAVGGQLRIVNVDGVMDDVDFVYRGTDVADVFTQTSTTIVLNTQIEVLLVDVNNLTLAGLGGDDTFNLNAVVPFNQTLIDGGEPGASDVLNMFGTAAVQNITVEYFTAIIPGGLPVVATIPVAITVTGLGGTIGLKGVEAAHIDGNGGNDTLTVVGTEEDDTFTYTPTRTDNTPQEGRFTNALFNEVFTFDNIPGTFAIDGGGAFEFADTVIVRGTNGPDFINVDSPNRVVTVDDPTGTELKPVMIGAAIEIVTVEALGGNDTILVTPAPATQTGPGGSGTTVPLNLLINIDGGSPSASDALVVAQAGGAALPASDFVVLNRSRSPDQGVVRVYRNGTALPDITYVNTEVVSPIMQPVVNPVQDPPLLILGPDNYEQNEFLANAAFLGSGSTINIRNLAIFPNAQEHLFVPADQDWFRVVAQTTGTLDFQAYFRVFPSAGAASLPGGGDLSIEAYDVDGNLITGFGTNNTTADARVRIPAVAGQTYYIRIFGAAANVINGYDLTVINEAPPVPWGLELYDVIVAANVASGVSTTVFTSTSGDLSQQNDFYNGKYVHFTSGPANGLRGLIQDYSWAAGTGTFTLAAPLAVTPQQVGQPPVSVIPANGNTFEIESNDTGRSQFDNITRDDTPLIFLRLDDGIFLHDLPGNGTDDSPPDQVIPIPFQGQTLDPGYRIAIFDEGDVPPQQSDPPQTPVGFATAVPGQEGVYFFQFTTPLSEGSHFITARVQMIDPSADEETGFGPRSLPLEIVVDVSPGPAFFGLPFIEDDGLDAGSDTGVIGLTETFSDNITSDTTPTFFGTAEADTVVRVYVDLDNDGILEPTDYLIGQTVATPIDGTNQFPGGRWQVTSNVDLNDPAYFPHDGIRNLFVTTEDVAGNQGPAPEPEMLSIFIDTQGPQVTEVFITDEPGYDLFGLKPDSEFQGPTPLIFSLTIRLQDLPERDAMFLYDAIAAITAETPGVIQLIGDHNGIIEIDDIIVTNFDPVAGDPALAEIELVFDTPLPDDRFTLILNDTIRDPAGNQLDGESDADEPIGGPFIPPSGDGQPGGDFIARFTVDSRPEVGTYAAANIYIDANGNFLADFQGKDNDFTNRDLNFALGIAPSLQGTVSPMNIHDGVFAGNFPRQAGEGGLVADGFDKLAAYGYDNLIGKFRWLIDVNHDGVINPADGDHATIQPAGFQINGLPVAGNFDGNAANGDEIGLFDGTKWYFDTNHNWVIDGGDLVVTSALRGTPIVGDFNGDGIEDLGTWRNDHFEFDFGAAGPSWNGAVEATINWGLPGVSELPVAADMDQDGITDIGLYEPPRTGTLPLESGNWQFLLSNDFSEEHRGGNQVDALNHPFSPSPLGNDLFAQFGDAFALPIVGNFDPPVDDPQLPTPESIGSVLGTMTKSATTGSEHWYEFTPLRSGTITVDASSQAGNVLANIYTQDFALMQSASPLTATAGDSSASVTAGNTYLVRLKGPAAPTTLKITNDVPLADRADTTRDGRVSPQDALYVINEILAHGSHATPMDAGNPIMYLDSSLDGRISPRDLLIVINYLLASQQSAARDVADAEPTAAPAASPARVATTEPVAESASATDTSSVGVSLSMGRTATEPTASPAVVAVDAAYTELAAVPAAASAPAADAAWADYDELDLLLADEASDLDLDWTSDET